MIGDLRWGSIAGTLGLAQIKHINWILNRFHENEGGTIFVEFSSRYSIALLKLL